MKIKAKQKALFDFTIQYWSISYNGTNSRSNFDIPICVIKHINRMVLRKNKSDKTFWFGGPNLFLKKKFQAVSVIENGHRFTL